MADIAYLGAGRGHHRTDGALRPLGIEHVRLAMFDLVLGAIVAVCLAAYLAYALLHPEKL